MATVVLAAVAGCAALSDEDVLYSANDRPRLYNGEPARTGPVLNVNSINADDAARAAVPYTGYVGDLRVDYAPDFDTVRRDVIELRAAGAATFDPARSVTVDFDGATVNFVLQQLLGGALGVNYIAPADLGGSITFRTEQPIPQSQVLQVVRDILGRQGLELRLVNGVYHVGAPELIAQVASVGDVGNSGEQVTRIVRLPRSNARDVVAVVAQLLPTDVNVMLSTVADTVVVRANPNDVQAVEDMLVTMSGMGVGTDQVAIVPLREGSPVTVATQLSDFYAQMLPQEEMVTIVPLESQQAILIGTRDPSLMGGLRQLVAQLDRNTADEVSLRIIPLTYLAAEQVAEQLGAIFGGASGPAPSPDGAQATLASAGGGGSGQGGGQSGGRLTLVPQLPQTQSPFGDVDEDGVALSIPNTQLRFEPLAGSSGDPSQVVADGFSRLEGQGPVVAGGGAPGAPRIVADTRTNSVMVYSTYAVYRRMQQVLQTIDVPQSQVVIEATVIEVDLNDELQSGVQFLLEGAGVTVGSSGTVAPTPGAAGGFLGVSTSLGEFDIEAVLGALGSVTRFKVISSPYLTVMDGRSARLVIGDQIPYVTRTQESSNTGGVTVTEDVEVRDTGIILEVTPRIHSSNSVDLTINQSVSTPSESVRQGDRTPIIATRDIQSQILAQSGRTILLGGLIQDRLERGQSGTPGLSDVPLVGSLFRSNNDRIRRVELLVLITPRVIRSSSQIEDLTRMLRSQFHVTPLGTTADYGGPSKPEE